MRLLLKILIPVLFLVVFIIPGYAFFRANPNFLSLMTTTPLDDPAIYLTVFRLFGLYAFVFLWMQIMTGPFTRPLSSLYGAAKVLRWHRSSGLFTFLLATLHPLLFHLGMFLTTHNPVGFFSDLEKYLGSATFVWVAHFGPFAWILMALSIVAALLRDHPLLFKHWRKVHVLNYLVFILAFWHSYSIGSDTQIEPLKTLYLFFGVTFLAAFTYRVLYRRILANIILASGSR